MSNGEKAMAGLIGLAVTYKVTKEILKDYPQKRRKKKKARDLGWGEGEIGIDRGKIGW